MAVRHAFTVAEWHRMGEAGLFGEDARMELLDGEVIEMSPIGSPHAACVGRLNVLLIRAVGRQGLIFPQNPVVLDPRSEPQPDMAVLAPRPDGYSRSHATPPETLLLVEVSDTTLGFDLERKAPYYGRSGVRESWVVDLAGDRIVVHRGPGPAGYDHVEILHRGDDIGIEALDGVRLRVADILGPDWPRFDSEVA
jgi:Uma2 family endonuclease